MLLSSSKVSSVVDAIGTQPSVLRQDSEGDWLLVYYFANGNKLHIYIDEENQELDVYLLLKDAPVQRIIPTWTASSQVA